MPDFRQVDSSSSSHQDSMVLMQRQKCRSMEQIEIPEINPHTYEHVISEKGSKNIQ